MKNLEQLKYPIGKFTKLAVISNDLLQTWIAEIDGFSGKLKTITKNISVEQLNCTYRHGGWTVKQVIHHCADSHMTAYIRFKLAATQILPVINPYDEAQWATFIDANDNNIEASISIIKGVHKRWVLFLKSATAFDFKKEYYHPANNENVSIETDTCLYAWHCNHHLAHIEKAIAMEQNF